jgi:molecular chaperone GrpE (heat shock protein)
MALEKELRVLHLVLKGTKRKNSFHMARKRVSKPTPTVTHFLQQGYTYSNKAIRPDSATF